MSAIVWGARRRMTAVRRVGVVIAGLLGGAVAILGPAVPRGGRQCSDRMHPADGRLDGRDQLR